MLRRLVNDWNEGLEGVNKPKATCYLHTHTHTQRQTLQQVCCLTVMVLEGPPSLSLSTLPSPPLSPLFPISHGADLSNAGSQSGFSHQV